jgi:actin-like ATPase involved in cell morphogenesis
VGYGLGVDVGTTFTAAALNRDGIIEMVPLATYAVAVPSVIFAEGAVMLFGGPADRRGAAQPMGLAREFKRRLGDPVPLMLSGSPYHADRLTALMVQWVVETVSTQIGSSPTQVVLTHPANWTEYQLGTLRNALADVKLEHTVLISEPASAALDFGAVATVAEGSTILVYDLGGGTFDVALLRRQGDTFEHQVEPAGIERLGGIDFDESVFQHVLATVPPSVREASRQNVEGAAAIGQLRRRCVDAKEALSSDVATDIPVLLPGYTASVRLTRSEFEAMIRPMVRQTIDVVENTLDRANLAPSELGAVLLVGGSSRIPLVPETVTRQLGVPVRVDAHPKLVVAKGAARRAGLIGPVTPPARREIVHAAGDDDGRRASGWTLKIAALAAVTAVLAVGGSWFLLRDDDEGSAETDQSTAPVTAGSIVGSAHTTTPSSTSPLVTAKVPAPGTVPSVVVVVPGEEFWTDTGIDVTAGDIVEVEASGLVTHADSAGPVGPDGDLNPAVVQFNRLEGGTPLPGNHAALIGRIGEGAAFVIGASATVTAEGAGRLVLGVNDQGVDNNGGAFDVTLIVTGGPDS